MGVSKHLLHTHSSHVFCLSEFWFLILHWSYNDRKLLWAYWTKVLSLGVAKSYSAYINGPNSHLTHLTLPTVYTSRSKVRRTWHKIKQVILGSTCSCLTHITYQTHWNGLVYVDPHFLTHLSHLNFYYFYTYNSLFYTKRAKLVFRLLRRAI